MQVQMVGATDIGHCRKSNQDSLFYDQIQGIGIVADGVGGRPGGDVASYMAVNGIRNAFINCEKIRHEEIHPFLVNTIDSINKEVIEKGRDGYTGMGTTLNCLVFLGDKLHIAHIGDSRTYLYYQRHLWQLTSDHNLKTFLARGWILPPHVPSNLKETRLLRAVGFDERCEVDIYEKIIKDGDIYITATDGFFDMVDDKQITQIIDQNSHRYEKLPALLIEEANKRGGRDNITVLLSKVVRT